jgi:YD repeat-containing protein
MSSNSYTLKSFNLYLIVGVAVAALSFAITYGLARREAGPTQAAASITPSESNKEMDGLTGPVQRVRTESARLVIKSGNLVEGPRQLLELSTYDTQGKRVDNAYYLIASDSQAANEEYAYDERGNISETTARDGQNAILSREVYAYEFDAVGNWTKMLTSRVVYEGGKLTRQPVEVTYRNISYYFDQTISEIIKPPTSPSDEQGAKAAKDSNASLRDSFTEWLDATNARDIEKLMKFYNSKVDAFYRNRDVTKDAVRAEKTLLFERASSVDVRADEPEIKMGRDERTAIMSFRKQYLIKEKGRDWRGEVLQQLRWQLTGEGWKIVSERDVRVIRRSTQRTEQP